MNLLDPVYAHLAASRKSYTPSGNYASLVGFPCERRLVYERLNYTDKPLEESRTLLIFRDGNMHEDAVLQLLRDAGLKVTEQQRPFEIKPLNLRGKIDAMVAVNGERPVPLEIKSLNTHSFARINSAQDLLTSDKPWVVGYYAQMQVYLLMSNQEAGILLLKDKNTGQLKQIDVTLDYAYAESLWKKLERVEHHITLQTYPDRIADRGVCQWCPFKAVCLPAEDWGSLAISDDATVLELLEKSAALSPFAKEYAAISDQLKEHFKTLAIDPQTKRGEVLYGGKWLVQISEYSTTIYSIPPDVKEQYKVKDTRTRTKIINVQEPAHVG